MSGDIKKEVEEMKVKLESVMEALQRELILEREKNKELNNTIKSIKKYLEEKGI